MNTTEFPHNTAEQVEEYVAAALELVERLEVPDDLRGVAFNQAVALYSAKQIVLEQLPAVPGLLAPQH